MSSIASVLAGALLGWLRLRTQAGAGPGQSSVAQDVPGQVPYKVCFSNGRTAQLLEVPLGMSAETILAALGFQSPRPVIALVGGASKLDERVKPRLAQLFSRAIARVAANRQAVIIDGGTQAGVMALIGQAVADRGHRSDLLGVAPAGKVTYPDGPTPAGIPDGAPLEPNHTHFVLVQHEEWGSEVSTMDALAQVLAGSTPAVTILADGGPIAVDEVVRSVRRRWPIIILAGTGRLADAIAIRSRKKRPQSITDPRLAEILAEGKLHVFPANGSAADLARTLDRHLAPPTPDPALETTWRLFAWLDANAKTERRSFERLQKWILGLGLLATLLALVQAQLGAGWPPAWPAAVTGMLPTLLATVITTPLPEWLLPVLRVALVVVTIATTVLLGVMMRFKAGTRWVLLRGGAEAIKREIFRYRAGVEPYTDPPPAHRLPRPQELVKQMNTIASQVFTTEISELALAPYRGLIPPPMYGAAADDLGFGPLSASRYVAIRVGDQINYYQGRAGQLDRRLRLAQWATLILGGVATLLAVVGGQLWVPLTAALIAAIATYLEYQQVAPTLTKYNQAATNLLGVQAWWAALPAAERVSPSTLQNLVDSTEQILEAELTGWGTPDARRTGQAPC